MLAQKVLTDLIHGSLTLETVQLVVFDEPTETVAMPLYNQIMQNFYYNSSRPGQLASILAFLPFEPLFEGKSHFTEPLYTLCNVFHAEVLSPTDLAALQT